MLIGWAPRKSPNVKSPKVKSPKVKSPNEQSAKLKLGLRVVLTARCIENNALVKVVRLGLVRLD